MQLTLSDGTTTVTLSGDGTVIRGATYFPSTADRSGATYSNVTETAQVIMRGNQATIRAAVTSIDRLFEQAALRQQGGTNAAVYVNHRPVDSESTYRAEILGGRTMWDTNPGLRRLGDTNPTVRVAVIWTRRYYWEGAETTISNTTLTNGPTGNSVSWSVTGSLPAPVRFTLQNNAGVSVATKRIYVANDVANVFQTGDHFLYVPGGSESSSWAGPSSHSDLRWLFDVPTALAARLRGERYRLWVAYSFLTAGTYLRPTLYAKDGSSYIPLQVGGEVRYGGDNGGQLMDLGAINLPPSGFIGSNATFTISVSAFTTSAGSGTVRWLMLAPAHTTLDLRNAYTLALTNGQSLVHDGVENPPVGYLVRGSARVPGIDHTGALLLYPGMTNRLRILFDEGDPFVPTRSFVVSGVYRPRRLTV